MEAAGLVNVYVCKQCGGRTVTKNRDAGTTPFMMSCRATPNCKGIAQSSFYRVDQKLTPRLLWIKPTPAELLAFCAEHAKDNTALEHEILEHVAMGGLLEVPAPEFSVQ